MVSTFTGLAIGLLLHTIGLDLPLAFGLLSFLCNFLPGRAMAFLAWAIVFIWSSLIFHGFHDFPWFSMGFPWFS